MKEVVVAAGYHCPLCPDHEDDRFFACALFESPICEGCMIELSHFAEPEEAPDDSLIGEVEQATGRPWSECRAVILQGELEYYEQLQGGELDEEIQVALTHWADTKEQFLSWRADYVAELRHRVAKARRA
jgi:hypothetical protein